MAITSRNINFPRSITIIDSIDVRYTSPSTIDFTVSRWSSKEIPVQGTFNGSVAEGFQRRDFSFAPDTITVSGQGGVGQSGGSRPSHHLSGGHEFHLQRRL
ncbi:hypothetical protein M5E87_22580 [Flavonifractor plautii]|nr:hypothetical protein M5E87_22580 [Flavonifractor plautii]